MKKRLIGVVTSDKCNKTRRVEVERLYRHPKYGKTVRSRTICHVHDEENSAREGDTVEIVESRPLSKTKRWQLLRVVKSGNTAPPVEEVQVP
jgi:small subunit ribosomal protein S17